MSQIARVWILWYDSIGSRSRVFHHGMLWLYTRVRGTRERSVVFYPCVCVYTGTYNVLCPVGCLKVLHGRIHRRRPCGHCIPRAAQTKSYISATYVQIPWTFISPIVRQCISYLSVCLWTQESFLEVLSLVLSVSKPLSHHELHTYMYLFSLRVLFFLASY